MKASAVRNQLKTYYIISSLSSEDSWKRLPDRRKFETEKEATRVATELVHQRQRNGQPALQFVVLKAMVLVGHVTPPVKVQKLK